MTSGSRRDGGALSTGGAGRQVRMFPILLLLALLSILPYLNGLRGGFVFDDRYLAAAHPAVQGTGGFEIGRTLTAPYWGELQGALLWRPVTTLSFALDQRIGGGSPAWFHVVNLLLHAAVTILWALLVRRLTRRDALALVTGALFAVHPLHTEAVTWISGRAELLAAAFGLAGLHFALPGSARRWTRWLAPIAILLAIGSKESAVTIPLVLVLIGWSLGTRRPGGTPATSALRPPSRWIAVASFTPILVYVLVRRAVLGTWAGPTPDPMDNPMVGVGLAARIPTALECAGRYVSLVLWPARLSVDYSTPALTLVRTVTPLLALGVASAAGLVWLAIRRRGTPEGFGAGFAILTFALASNLPVVIGTIFAERLFYLPSAGILLAGATGGFALARRGGRVPARVLQAALLVVLVAGGVRTWVRNRDFRNEATLYAAGARTMPRSPKMRYNNALELIKEGRNEEALREGVEAIRLNPSSRESRRVIAGALDSLGRADEAIRMLETFLVADHKDHDVRRMLINMLVKKGEKARADSIAEAGMVEEPDLPEWIGRSARAAQERGELSRAIPLWREARARAPDAPDAALNLAWCLLRSGDPGGACDAYRDALRLMPSSALAANGLAWATLETGGDVAEAIRLAESATASEKNPSYFDTLARAYIAAARCPDAVRAAEQAVALAPDQANYRRRLDEARRCR